MKTIPLSRGLVTIVDDEDYELLSAHKWYAMAGRKRFYAARNARGSIRSTIFMHREIMGVPPISGLTVDHIDYAATLDNRRANLRWATMQQQNCNHGMSRNNTSGYKGVYLDRRRGRWQAKVKHNNVPIHIGCFATAEEAAAARAIEVIRIRNWMSGDK